MRYLKVVAALFIVVIISNGPDLEVGTGDDITFPVAIQRQRSRR